MTKQPFPITVETAGNVRMGLARDLNGQWFHVSSRGETVILRSLDAPAESRHLRSLLAEARQGYLHVSFDILRWYVTPGSEATPDAVGWEEKAYWRELAKRFDDDPDFWKPPEIPVPTELRRHYDDLRERGRAATPSASASTLATFFSRAVEQLASYRNLREGWAEEVGRKPCDDDTFARSVARQLRDHQLAAPWPYHFVARELAPLRATGADASDSGAGGIDVLLASNDDRALPIIVEVKSMKDTGAYLGLVQALTYASELITPHQRQRLARFHADRFAWPVDENGPFADIWIVVERGKQDPEHAPTKDLARLMIQDGAVSRLLRRIEFLELDPQARTLVPA